MEVGFTYKNKEYYSEEVPIGEIVKSVGTPCYIYSLSALEYNFSLYKQAFSQIDTLICYSVKANSNLAILNSFANLGAGFDIVSEGELYRVLKAGGDPTKVVFSGVGKAEKEMLAATEAGILFFNVESAEELELLNNVASGLGERARIAIRVNPDIDPKTHPYISTGFKMSKFGIEIGKAKDVYRRASEMEGIEVIALDAHIGSQIFDLSPFADSLKKLRNLADDLKEEGINIEYIDIGGGLGIRYQREEEPPHPQEYADLIMRELGNTSYKLVLEPGRSIMGNAGILVTKVIFTKHGTSKKFVIVDAAMNDLIRPAFYDSFHKIIAVDENTNDEEIVDIVGPICESGDFFARDRKIARVKRGDLLAILSAGAYGFVMSSNYNTRPRIAEVLVNGNEFYIVNKRESLEDLVRGETIPGFNKK